MTSRPYGFLDPNDLLKFEGEDLEKFKGCKWMIDYEYKKTENMWSRRLEALWWYNKLVKNLPNILLMDLKESLEDVSFLFDFDAFEFAVKSARMDVVQRLLADEIQKDKLHSKMIRDAFEREEKVKEEKKIRENIEKSYPKMTLIEYQKKKQNQLYEYGTPQWKKQREQKIPGYIPTLENMLEHPPIEILDYMGCRLIKYDMLHGIYVNIISSELLPNYDNSIILYGEDPMETEERGQLKFEEYIDKKIKQENNPYGKIECDNIDISNITKVMEEDKDNPLNNDDIF